MLLTLLNTCNFDINRLPFTFHTLYRVDHPVVSDYTPTSFFFNFYFLVFGFHDHLCPCSQLLSRHQVRAINRYADTKYAQSTTTRTPSMLNQPLRGHQVRAINHYADTKYAQSTTTQTPSTLAQSTTTQTPSMRNQPLRGHQIRIVVVVTMQAKNVNISCDFLTN